MRRIKRKTFETAPEGNHPARITCVADLGEQTSNYDGTERVREMLGITFELTNEKTKEGKPFAIFSTVTRSLQERAKLHDITKAALKKVPEEIDPEALLGKTVMVDVVHREGKEGTVWANVDAVTPVPKGLKIPRNRSELLAFDPEDPDTEVYGKLPALFRKLIEKRHQRSGGPKVDPDEDVPL